jgi:serine/threonine-protein kinase
LLQEGHKIAGSYVLKRVLGKGGEGAIWKAHHVHLDRPVAIKVLDVLSIRSEVAQARFIREARILARLESPHVVQIFDAGVEEGTPYLVMELLEGETLADRQLREPRVSLRTVLKVAQGVAAALEAAHYQGFIHRDIKPKNIFFDVRNGVEVVKLFDFGIAKLPEVLNEPQTATLLGTPAYVSPEQAQTPSDVDHRSDLWSLAVVLFEALTGKRPFGPFGTAEVVANGFLPLAFDPSTLDLGLPTALDTFFRRALAREPGARFQNAREMAEAITAIIGPLAAAEPSSPWPATVVGESVLTPALALVHRPAAFPRPAMVAAPHDPWEGLSSALAESLQENAVTVARFLRSLFGDFKPLARNVIRLGTPLFPGSGSQPFFAVFVAGTNSQEARLQTRTFTQYSEPLEEHLSLLEPGLRKVVIAIVDSEELGGGVRGRIFEFRKKFGAIVLPLHVRELGSALQEENPHQLFLDRLSDFHTPPDVFAIDARKVDPTSIFGLRRRVNELTRLLQEATPFVSLTGLPGSGKTALIELARYGLENTRFVSVRCIQVPERRVSEVAALVARAFEEAPSTAAPAGIRERLEAAIAAARQRLQGQRIVLVIEDADFCISALTDEQAPAEERRDARLFWTTLADLSRTGTCAVVVTSLAGSRLSDTVLSGWANPLANHVHVLRVDPLSLEDVRRMCVELGRQINVSFEEAALRRIYEVSAGNVYVVRCLCSQAINTLRRAGTVNPLQELHVSDRDIARAAVHVAGTSDTFRGNLLPWLEATDKQVLEVVATQRPRNIKSVRETLKGQAPPEQCDAALERLRRMGLVEHREGRERISIPLLEQWVPRHLPPAVSVENQRRDQRFRYLALGTTTTLLLFGGYFLLTLPQEVTWKSEHCVGQINYQGRVVPDQQVNLHLFRDCKQQEDATPVSLSARMGTFARIGEQQVSTLVLQGQGRAESIPPGWTQLELPVLFRKVTGRSTFELDIRVGEEPVAAVIIRDDWIAGLPGLVKALLAIAGVIPLAFGLIHYFHQDVKSRLRKLLSRKEEESEPPKQGEAP